MSYKKRNPYMSINHGLIGGKREAQKGYISINTSCEYASMYSQTFTFDSFDEMQNNPYLTWEYRLRNLWQTAHLSDFIEEQQIATIESEKYKSLYRFVGENEEHDDLITTWNNLLDFDIEAWFNKPYNTDEHYEIKRFKGWPNNLMHWMANQVETGSKLHRSWGGWDLDWYITIGYMITANEIKISSSDTTDETFGNQHIIRKIGDIPYEIQK